MYRYAVKTVAVSVGFIVLNSFSIQAQELTAEQEEAMLKPPVKEALQLLSALKAPMEEYMVVMGHFLSDWDIMAAQTSGQYVATITLHPEESAYQAVLRSEAEGVEKALAGKTVRLTFNSGTQLWTCSTGQPDGVEEHYLPVRCRSSVTD
jgi:hypothetical protein